MKLTRLIKNNLGGLLVLLFFFQFSGCTKEVVKNTEISKISENQISLAVIVKAKDGREEELKKALIALVGPTRKEEGCINYTFHIDPNDKSRFMFYENWESKKLLDAHLNAPHIKAFGEKAGELVANTLDLTNWIMVD